MFKSLHPHQDPLEQLISKDLYAVMSEFFWMSAILKFWPDGYFGHPVFYYKETTLTGVEQLFGRRVET